MDIYQGAIVILFTLAISDLIVGVSNDAVNFLNSSVGSRVAPRHVIMIIASLGILAGVTFSSGMMEVARKGIFHPQFFTMPELMTIFLAVMLTDIILLDLYNTFGLPTSTTVSIVFELLGAAVAVSLVKISHAGIPYSTIVEYINTAKALAIISGLGAGYSALNYLGENSTPLLASGNGRGPYEFRRTISLPVCFSAAAALGGRPGRGVSGPVAGRPN